MDPNQTNPIPEFVLRDASAKRPLSESELREIESILIHAEGYQYPSAKTKEQWMAFRSKIEAPIMVVNRHTRYAMFRWVAAAVVVLTMGLGLWQYRESKVSTFSAVYKTNAQKNEYQLPDGSRVSLNSGSILEIKGINKHKRILELKTGEVFLTVTHTDIPFRVITNKGIITVLGTEFNVKNTDKAPFSIYLKSGRIEFETSDEKITLIPGDYLEQELNGDFIISHFSDNRSYAWVSGKLSFDNTPLSEVIKGLENLYNVKFVYDEKMNSEKLTITFENLNAQQAADLLGKTIKSSVTVVR